MGRCSSFRKMLDRFICIVPSSPSKEVKIGACSSLFVLSDLCSMFLCFDHVLSDVPLRHFIYGHVWPLWTLFPERAWPLWTSRLASPLWTAYPALDWQLNVCLRQTPTSHSCGLTTVWFGQGRNLGKKKRRGAERYLFPVLPLRPVLAVMTSSDQPFPACCYGNMLMTPLLWLGDGLGVPHQGLCIES